MGIIINELKKIFNIKSIILIFFIAVIMYKIFIIPSESINEQSEFINNIHVELVNKYGNAMDENEYKDFLNTYNEKVKIADEYVNKDKEFAKLGIDNYEEYNRIVRNDGEEKYQNPKLQDLYYEYYYYKDEITIFRELGEMENIKITYEGNVIEPFVSDYTNNKKAINRHEEIREDKEMQSLLPYSVFEVYEAQFKTLTMINFISIMLLISPVYLGDKLNKVDYLQYSSKNGCKIFISKSMASILSSLVVVTGQIIIFLKFFLNETTRIFLECNISGYYNSPIRSWYNLTFGQYILISIILLYILVIVMSQISFYISSKANKYITVIGIQVPILFIINTFLLKYILNNATSMYIQVSGFNYITTWKYFIPVFYTLILIISFLIINIRYKKEKKISI